MQLDFKPLRYFSKRWLKTDKIIVHWSGGYTLEAAFQALRNRKLSYHYLVDGGTIWQLVDEKSAAYHAGSWLANQQSVGVCHVGIYESPVKEESYTTSGQLLAEICRRNGFEPSGETIKCHRDFKATACPGTLDVGRLITEARKFYFGISPEVQPSIPQDNPQVVDNYPKRVKNVAGVPLRVRAEANTTSAINGYKAPGEEFTVLGETIGETINNNSKWLNTGYGYVSAEYAKE